MPRTFSLRLLLAGMTLACVLSALVTSSFPDVMIALALHVGMHPYEQLSLIVGLLLPSLLVGLVLAAIASRRRLAFGMSLLGGLIGWTLAPSVSGIWRRGWEENLAYVLQQMWGALGAALVIGGVIVVFDYVRWWRAKRRDGKPDQPRSGEIV